MLPLSEEEKWEKPAKLPIQKCEITRGQLEKPKPPQKGGKIIPKNCEEKRAMERYHVRMIKAKALVIRDFHFEEGKVRTRCRSTAKVSKAKAEAEAKVLLEIMAMKKARAKRIQERSTNIGSASKGQDKKTQDRPQTISRGS